MVESYPDLDCVFLNSGTQSQVQLSKPAEVNLEAAHSEINTNFTSIVNLMIKFLPHLQSKKIPTALIVTGTHLALIPAAPIPAYSASKAALHSFIYSLRVQAEKAGSPTKIVEIWPPLVQCTLAHGFRALRVANLCTLQRSCTTIWAKRGRGLGMPVDVFTERAYAQLEAGKDHVTVGAVGVASEDEFLEVVNRRQKIADTLNNTMLAHFQV